MTPTPTQQAVAAHPFLIGISEHHVRLLADSAMKTTFETDKLIFEEGDTANRFYLIENGRVALEAKGTASELVTIEVISDGDLLGWSWLFPPYVWHFSARALQPTNALFFYGTVLREYCDADPSLGFELFKRMGEVMIKRLQSARSRLVQANVGFSPVGGEHQMAGSDA